MEHLPPVDKEQEESAQETTSVSIQNKETPTDASSKPESSQVNRDNNLLYEQCLGFIPGALSCKRDPRYLYAKFPKDYKDFDFTYEEVLEVLEEAQLLQYLEILQISKPNKSIDLYFTTEDAAQFFVNKHIEIRGKPIPFIRKAKRILKVTINGIHPDLTDDELRSELYEYIAEVSSIKHPGRNYKGMVFKDGSRQLYVTSLTQHIPRSLKIGNRWCLVFYRDQPVPQRKPSQPPTVIVTPPSEELPSAQMEWEKLGPGTSADNMSNADPESSGERQRTNADEPMPEASLTSKRLREPEEDGKNIVENKKKKDEIDEFGCILEHLKVIVEELESSNFSNIEEVLGMYPTLDVERAIGSIIAMTGSTKPEGSMPKHTKKYYKERKIIIDKNLCIRTFHEELEKDGFYSKYLGKVKLFGSPPQQQPP